ncbi:MAG: chorismate-binding protein [Actinomycetota bacterium]
MTTTVGEGAREYAVPAASPGPGAFASLEPGYDMVMVCAEVSSDLETPISAFMKLRDGGPCFLLESAESDQMWGRYSFLGFDPGELASIRDGVLSVSRPGAGTAERRAGDPVRALFEMVESRRVHRPADVMPFAGGAVGYFGYDALPYLEKVTLTHGSAGIPETMFMFPRKIVMFDHLRSRMRLCAIVEPGEGPAERAESYARATAAIASMVEKLAGGLPEGSRLELGRVDSGDDFEGVESNVSRPTYESMVERAREYIFAGDAFQVVVSQKFSMPFAGDPLSIYRQLRAENPSPYMFHLELPDVTLVGSSPESMVANRGGTGVIRPIAGTRPRGADAAEDERLAAELAADEKERAEHIMLVDLARNDLGRVSRPGTVRVSRLMEIERYSHVMHMVSEVEGSLDGVGNHALLRASFPAGTVIGAPKVRASEIIDELEPDARGAYAGAIGYISYSGDMDTCIAIRTVVLREGRATVQAGGGIVADSVPSSEYQESRNKARAVVRAVRAASGEAS